MNKKLILCMIFCLNVVGAAAMTAAPSAPVFDPAPLATHIGRAVGNNPRVLAARAAVDAIRARYQAASQPLYNPELGLDLERAENDTAALGISQTVDWGDKRKARAEVANFKLQATEAKLITVRQAVGAALLNRLAGYRTARAIERIARRRVTLMQRFAAIAEQRRRAGDLGQVEFNLARLALAEARLVQSRTAAQRMTAEQAVRAITRADVASWPGLPLGDIVMPNHRFARQRYLTNLPALRAHQAQVAAARMVIEVRARQTQPDPTLSVRGGREDQSLLAGLSIAIPLYVRNDFHAEVDAANAELIQAERTARNAYQLARARLFAATARLRLTTRAWREWQDIGRESLRAQLDLLQRLWRAGELSGAEYLVQTRQALDTRVSAMALRGQLWRAWTEWLAASGNIGQWLRARRS